MVALQPPHLAEHLPPLRLRHDRHPDTVEVDPAAGAASTRLLVVGLGRGLDHPQTLARPVSHRLAVAGQRVGLDTLGERVDLQGVEIVKLQAWRGGLRPRAANAAFDRVLEKIDLVLCGGQAAVAAFGHGKLKDALADTVEIDHQGCCCFSTLDLFGIGRVFLDGHRCRTWFGGGGRRWVGPRAVRLLGLALFGLLILFLLRRRPFERARLGVKRRLKVFAQRHKVRPAPFGKTEVEPDRVVNRIKNTRRQEIQIFAIRVERGRGIAAHRLRDRVDNARVHFGDKNLGKRQLLGRRVRHVTTIG